MTPAPTMDRDRTVSRRSEPSSRAALIGEQPNPWDLLQPQDATSRHRGAKPPRRCGLLGRSACYPRGSFYPLSDGSSTRYRLITKPEFPLCSTCSSRSQAPFCLCTLRMISIHSEGTFGRLRYSLGGDRPSQTATYHCPSPRSLHVVRNSVTEEWYPNGRSSRTDVLPSLRPTYPVHPLPNSMISYSKALRGLSVQSRVMGIFTHTSISPSPLLRQRPSRYAIRAGRNLPDKEFRYLRTVIVTAAVYWGFNSLLRLL